jgi:predicted nucleotidyltransferase
MTIDLGCFSQAIAQLEEALVYANSDLAKSDPRSAGSYSGPADPSVMIKPIDIRPQDLDIVRSILQEGLPPDAKVWVFGSRATGATKRSSDLDLAIDAGRKLSLSELSVLNSAFEDSDLPYKVDLVDWAATGEAFRNIIERD